MNKYLLNDQGRHLMQREALSIAETYTVWRLESGALRIDSKRTYETEMLVRLAMPGDLIGVESLLGVQDRFTVRALTPSRLVPLELPDGKMPQLLKDSVITGYKRSCEMVQLRTGTAQERVKYLLVLLTEAGGMKGNATCALPTLGDIAGIVHVALETVCRVLASLRKASFLQDCSPSTAKYTKLEHRTHRLLTRGEIMSSVAGVGL